MRVVLDTNVIISAVLSESSPPALILEAWNSGLFDLLVTIALLDEYRRALGYDHIQSRHSMDDRDLDALVENYRKAGVLVQPRKQMSTIKEDPSDNRILECAEAGDATHIVSGDRHLLNLNNYEGILILSPRAFLEFLE